MRLRRPALRPYLLTTYLASGRGLAPFVVLILGFLLIWQAHLFAIDVIQVLCLLAVPYAAWITFVMLDAETESQEQVTASATAGLGILRLAKASTAMTVGTVSFLPPLAVTALRENPAAAGWVVAVAFMCLLTGCALADAVHATAGRSALPRLILTALGLVFVVKGGVLSPWAGMVSNLAHGPSSDRLSADLCLASAVTLLLQQVAIRRWGRGHPA